MRGMSNVIQNILILVGLIIVALLGGYLYLDQTNQSLSLSAFRSEPTVVDVQSQEFLARLEMMQSINLDTEQVFGDTHFRALVDYSQAVERVPVGRDNPFAPVSTPVSVAPTN